MSPARAATPRPAARLAWRQAMAWRARRHHLDKRVKAGGMLDVTRRLSGLQAQVMSSTELALWARVEDLPRDAVERALWQDRAMVKTWAMRGTLHLLAADDYWTYQPVLNEYRHYLAPGWLRAWEMSREDLDRLLAAVAVALDGAVLTRAELGAEVARRTKSAALGERVRGSWGMFLKPASYRGELCFGPGSGQNVAFTSPASWLGERPAVDPDQARLEVARRFLATHGPATAASYARWWGGTNPVRARKLIESLGEEVALIDLEGEPAYLLAADVAAAKAAEPPRSVCLLPAFDQYVVVASHHTERFMPGPHRPRVFRPQGWLSPVVVVDGRIDGTWKHERKGARLLVQVDPFVPLSAANRRGVEAEAERLAAFLGGRLEVSWKS